MAVRSSMVLASLAAFLTVLGAQCDPVSAGGQPTCCNCEAVNPMMPGTCDTTCTDNTLSPTACLSSCEIANGPASPCNLELVINGSCNPTTGCSPTGCCTINVSGARTVAGACIEADMATCAVFPGAGQFVAGGSCVGGLDGTCTAPTATATATATATVTITATASRTPTVTQTRTITQTPTNTLVPNGGDCVTPAQCASMFCVDGVCCNTPCDQPLETCNNPDDPGTCTTATAAVPMLSTGGVLIGLVVLCAIGALALMYRRAPR